MKQTEKALYEAPDLLLIRMEQEGVTCTSGGTESFTDGDEYGNSLFY